MMNDTSCGETTDFGWLIEIANHNNIVEIDNFIQFYQQFVDKSKPLLLEYASRDLHWIKVLLNSKSGDNITFVLEMNDQLKWTRGCGKLVIGMVKMIMNMTRVQVYKDYIKNTFIRHLGEDEHFDKFSNMSAKIDHVVQILEKLVKTTSNNNDDDDKKTNFSRYCEALMQKALKILHKKYVSDDPDELIIVFLGRINSAIRLLNQQY